MPRDPDAPKRKAKRKAKAAAAAAPDAPPATEPVDAPPAVDESALFSPRHTAVRRRSHSPRPISYTRTRAHIQADEPSADGDDDALFSPRRALPAPAHRGARTAEALGPAVAPTAIVAANDTSARVSHLRQIRIVCAVVTLCIALPICIAAIVLAATYSADEPCTAVAPLPLWTILVAVVR